MITVAKWENYLENDWNRRKLYFPRSEIEKAINQDKTHKARKINFPSNYLNLTQFFRMIKMMIACADWEDAY